MPSVGAADMVAAPMEVIEDILAKTLAGVSVQSMLIALVAIVAGFALGRLVESALRRLTGEAPEGSLRYAVLHAFDRPVGWMVRVAGIWMGINAMPLGNVEAFDVDRFVFHLLQASTIALATWLAVRIVDGASVLWAAKAGKTEGTYDDQLVPIGRKSLKAFFVVTGAVMVIQNLGYSVSSLLAGVGIGGAALAFASKDTVANFFGSLVIFIDRPFMIGDWIEVGQVEGTVEVVGIRVTRIRTFANSLLTIPNAQFTTTPINNWSRMRKRRIKMTIGLTYDSSPDRIREAVEAIRAIIRNDDRLHQDFYLVNFFDLGPSSLDIFCYLFTRTTNWAEHMQIREEFLLRVMQAMHGLGLSFAFPTQTVHLAGDLPSQPPGPGAPGRGTPARPVGSPPAMERDTPL